MSPVVTLVAFEEVEVVSFPALIPKAMEAHQESRWAVPPSFLVVYRAVLAATEVVLDPLARPFRSRASFCTVSQIVFQVA